MNDKPKYDFLKPKYKNPGGQPTKYKPEYCDQMFEYFCKEPFEIKEVISFNKFGNKCTSYVETPNKVPYFINFARKIGIHRDTLNEWTRVHPDFTKAFWECKELQRNFLTENAMRGNFNATAYRFAAINYTNMVDKCEVQTDNRTTTVNVNQEDARKIADQLKKDLS